MLFTNGLFFTINAGSYVHVGYIRLGLFSHSFIQAISIAPPPLILNVEGPLAIVSKGLAQGPYVAARAGFQPETLRTKGDESTNDPPRMLYAVYIMHLYSFPHSVPFSVGLGLGVWVAESLFLSAMQTS